MDEYWESRFREEKAMWKYEPSDSALTALEYFKSLSFKNILIPGFGYGRNGKLFVDNGFDVCGIEISGSAIDIAKADGLDCRIHHGSVTEMPFDNDLYDGIFCYALIHLLNRDERRKFLKACYGQLKSGGLMIFTMASVEMSMYGNGKYLSKNRYQLAKGLNVYFYDSKSLVKEFEDFGIWKTEDIEEPVKHLEGQEALKLKLAICQKK